MQSDPYSRELIDEKLKVILAAIHEVREIAIETREQAKKTNGRVTALEGKCIVRDEFDPIADWTKIAKGAVAVLLAIVLPILGFLSYQVIETQQVLSTHIGSTSK